MERNRNAAALACPLILSLKAGDQLQYIINRSNKEIALSEW
jgi:hypothetical protein